MDATGLHTLRYTVYAIVSSFVYFIIMQYYFVDQVMTVKNMVI